MDEAKAAPNIPKCINFMKTISSAMFTKAGIIMANIANLALPSALMILFPIIHNARRGTENMIGKKNSTRFMMEPLAKTMALLKRYQVTQIRMLRKVIMIWLAKVVLSLFL
jgi:hypothetical protein